MGLVSMMQSDVEAKSWVAFYGWNPARCTAAVPEASFARLAMQGQPSHPQGSKRMRQ